MVQPLWETVWWFFTKLDILVPCASAIVLHVILPKELKTFVQSR